MSAFSDNLKRLLKKKDISQHRFWELLKQYGFNMQYNTVVSYVNGTRDPHSDFIPLAANILDVSIDTLYNGIEISKIQTEKSALSLTIQLDRKIANSLSKKARRLGMQEEELAKSILVSSLALSS